MKPFLAVIGDGNSGKSTVIRSLTGCPTRSHRDVVTDRLTNRSIFVIASSPQEQVLERSEFEEILRRVVDDPSIIGLVMAIQPTEPRVRLSMEEIFGSVQATRRLTPIAVMLYPPYNTGGSTLPQSIQTRLSRLSIDLKIADGRHFAHLNAATVRELAKIP